LLAGLGVTPETATLIGGTLYITAVLSSLPGGLAVFKLSAPSASC
jgi:hypothetical protein